MMLLFFDVSAMCFIFFFQAEDGIRDWSVTGVQTCALPIYRVVVRGLGGSALLEPLQQVGRELLRNDHDAVQVADDDVAGVDDDTAGGDRVVDLAGSAVHRADRRSEERRVGKECRAAWRRGT